MSAHPHNGAHRRVDVHELGKKEFGKRDKQVGRAIKALKKHSKELKKLGADPDSALSTAALMLGFPYGHGGH